MYHSPNSGVCQWPGCRLPALCASQNFGGRLVCAAHFSQTNGGLPPTLYYKRRKCRKHESFVAWCSPVALTPGADPVTDPAEPLWFEFGRSGGEALERLRISVEAETGPARWEEMQL